MDTKFDGTDEFFDSRDIVEKIEELITEFEVAVPEVEGEEYQDPRDCQMSTDDWKLGLSDDDAELLAALIALREEADGRIADWAYGETFYEREYFRENYAEEFCKDVGYFPEETPTWITDHIDWEAVADALLEDYHEFEVFGRTYVAR